MGVSASGVFPRLLFFRVLHKENKSKRQTAIETQKKKKTKKEEKKKI